MASVTIRNIDDEVKAALRLRAARRGVSMESEVRDILRRAVSEPVPVVVQGERERTARIARILAFGQPPLESFDLKSLSDAVSDGTE